MLSKFLLTLIIFGCQAAYSEDSLTCEPIELKEKATGLTVSLQVTCYDAKNFHVFSKNCLEQKCELARRVRMLEDQQTIYEKLLGSAFGNPSYKLCDRIGAKTFYVKIPLAFMAPAADGLGICMLKSDASFVDVGTLWSWLQPPTKSAEAHQNSP